MFKFYYMKYEKEQRQQCKRFNGMVRACLFNKFSIGGTYMTKHDEAKICG